MVHTGHFNTRIPIEKLGIILSPSRLEFENNGALNPGIFQEGKEVHMFYHAAAALLDRADPTKVIGRLPYPLFSPSEKYEIEGVVNYVVFPTGTALFDDDLYIYYGAADKYVAVAKVCLKMLITELLLNKV